MIAQPSERPEAQQASDEAFLELLAETLGSLEESARRSFLQSFFRTLAQLELTEAQSLECWSRAVERRSELAESLGKPVSLRAALMDVLASASYLRMPVLVEYEEFRKLKINAATDSLTGLYNRRLFEEYSEKELNRAKRYGQHLALVILDLHHLKEVNDQHGHMQGDAVLRMAARALRKTLRASDFAFRIGGDEFALLLPQTDPEQAATLCRRLCTHYEEELRPLNLGIAVALDYGIAVHPLDGDQKAALMQLADERLYQLKQTHRAPSRVIPIEPVSAREAPVAAPKSVANSVSSGTAAAAVQAQPFAVQRKWERVSLAGTRSHATLDAPAKSAAVLDLSYGGVALLLDRMNALPEQFFAVLHVPILPPTRVHLRKVYSRGQEGGRTRIGCLFVA